MAGFRRRRFAEGMLRPPSIGWWGLLLLAIVGSCRCGVWAAESPAMEPSAAPSVNRAEAGGCDRPLSDVIWGFLVTLLALTVSFWSTRKHRTAHDKASVCFTILVGVLAPLEDLGEIILSSLWCVSLLWICHKMQYPNARTWSSSWLRFLCSSLFPWSKSPVRILSSCDIVVYVSTQSPILKKQWLWNPECLVKDESEALVIGETDARRIQGHQGVRKQLSLVGIGLVVWKEVFSDAQNYTGRLPKYDELKYLRGNSGFAVIAIAVQALGYIYAFSFRGARGLKISPLEIVNLVFNIILVMKVFFYSTCNPCHRPLVIYMDDNWERELQGFDDNVRKKFERYGSRKVRLSVLVVIFMILNSVVIYCICKLHKNVRISLILFLIGLWLGFWGWSVPTKYLLVLTIIVTIGCTMIAMAYIWALVDTVLYWRTMHFNTRGKLINFSQIIPFIG